VWRKRGVAPSGVDAGEQWSRGWVPPANSAHLVWMGAADAVEEVWMVVAHGEVEDWDGMDNTSASMGRKEANQQVEEDRVNLVTQGRSS
jgi:hypothetical protein